MESVKGMRKLENKEIFLFKYPTIQVNDNGEIVKAYGFVMDNDIDNKYTPQDDKLFFRMLVGLGRWIADGGETICNIWVDKDRNPHYIMDEDQQDYCHRAVIESGNDYYKLSYPTYFLKYFRETDVDGDIIVGKDVYEALKYYEKITNIKPEWRYHKIRLHGDCTTDRDIPNDVEEIIGDYMDDDLPF